MDTSEIEIREVQKETGREIRYSGREKLAIEISILRNKIEGKLEEIRRPDNHFGEVWGSLEEIGRERQRSEKKRLKAIRKREKRDPAIYRLRREWEVKKSLKLEEKGKAKFYSDFERKLIIPKPRRN